MKTGGLHLNKYARALELWLSYPIASAADLNKYLHSFRILFAFHSGKLENDDITYHETKGIFENELILNYEDEELSSLYEFFKYQVEKTWKGAMALANDFRQDREALSVFIKA